MKKVLFYINTLNMGGAERVMVQLTKHFSDAGWETVLVTSYPLEKEYAVSDKVKRLCLEAEQLHQSKLKRNLTRIQKLRWVCKQEKPDVMIAFMQEPNLRAVLASIGLPTKCIVSVRNDPDREYPGRLGKIVGKWILPMADGCVFQTEDAKAWFPKRLQRKSAIIQNEVTTAFFDKERGRTGNIVTVGRLSAQKNHGLLIDAFAEIAPRYPEEKLLIYGEGACRTQLQERIAQLHMEDRVYLMGLTDNVPQVLSEAKLFVLSSDFEGMPNCLLEAMAVGVPSISTDCPCGGPKTIIQNGENGILVPVGNKTEMANAMDKMLADPELLKKIGRNAKESSRKFLPDAVFLQWQTFVEQVIMKTKQT